MKRSSKKASVIFITFCAIVIIVVLGICINNYVKHDFALTKSPRTTEFTDEDITKFQNAFLIKFPKNTRFVEAQYFYSFQEPRLSVVFEIPVASTNTFLDEIKQNYKEVIISDNKDNAENYYESENRQFTNMYLYHEENGFKKVKYYYWRPSDNMSLIFTR